MDSEKATMLVGYLVGATTGWNDEAVLVYVDEFKKLSDEVVLQSAVQQVIRTWAEARRPPISVVLDAYRSELSARQLSRPALQQPKQRRVPPSEGIKIARDAYEQECKRLGKKPNFAKFDRNINAVARSEK